MASEEGGGEIETTNHEKKAKQTGITIDSNLIHTASVGSSDVADELSGLGVSVYNQQEFEAGVLKQIDTEVQRRNAEQDRKFLLKEYSTIKAEINSVRIELSVISKTIAGLLVQPLSSVGSRLRELRTAQDQKKKQLLTLEAREHTALKKLTGKHPSTSDATASSSEPNDVPFGFPMPTGPGGGVAETNEQRLIQTGQLTPFGSSVDTPAHVIGESGGASAIVQPEATAESAKSRKVPVVKLCLDSFDGLFSNGITDTPGKRRIARIPKKKKVESSEQTQSSDIGSESHTDSLEPNTENVNIPEPSATSVEPNTENASSDCDSWMPSLADLLESDSPSSDSEYFTDEEMGDTLEGKKRKKMKRLRPLSSDDLSDEDERSPKKKKTKRKSGDDGDRNLYRQRLRDYEREMAAAESVPADMTFDGGLTIPGAIWYRLYRYQQTGVKWLWELHCQQAGGVVGDEMGLGKTIQVIAFLAGLKISNLRSHVTRKLGLGPVLIVAPATVLHQWVYEFHRWWAPFRVAVLHGTGSHGGSKKRLVQEIVDDNGVLITTYSGIRLHQDLLLSHKWDYVVLDEGHKIRNPDAGITLACKQVLTPHRLILSGSPVQNNLRELWSLFDFVFPGKLGTLPVFLEQFSVPITMGGYANATEVQVQTAYKCACILRDTINPYMLRRMKADVKIQLPDKNEQVLFCRLTDYQCELYRDYVRSKTVERMLERGKEVFSGLMALRKLCSHPDLVTNDYSECMMTGEAAKDEDDVSDMILVPKHRKRRKKGDALEADPEDEESYGHWRRSGKMVVVDSLLKLWKAQGHKVLIFSQLKLMLDILERFVSGRDYTYQRMDGNTPISSRQPLVNKFNQDDSIFIFLLTTRVGGLGINLTGADRVIIYDPDWNPSTDTQARERAWRIGQTRQVTIYRLLTSGTIEEKIYHRQIFKQFLTNRVLKDPRQRRFFKSNNLHELFTLSSSAIEGSTETSAIFAGTNSEIVPRSSKSRGSGKSTEEKVGKKRKRKDSGDKTKKKSRKKPKKSQDVDSEAAAVEWSEEGLDQPIPNACTSTTSVDREEHAVENESEFSRVESNSEELLLQDKQELAEETKNELQDKTEPAENRKAEKEVRSPKGKTELRELRGKKKRRKKRKKPAEVEGERIEGLAYSSVFNPGQEDEEQSGKQDDFILHKLFKKSGVHSAMQHDTIMNSSNPDYVLVESEASKVAKSAARALKDSRRHCLQTGAGRGRATWTGQHGAAGAPTPRFGVGINPKVKMNLASQKSFSGMSSSEDTSGSLNTSSNVLLAQMRRRNTQATSDGQEAGMGGAIGIHGDDHSELVKEIRDFIATESKVNGQATTAELLGKFAKGLPRSDAATFRSMLYEICDFSRHRGDGLWSLKPEFK